MKQKKKLAYRQQYRLFRSQFPNVSAIKIREATLAQRAGVGRPKMVLHWAQADYFKEEYGLTMARARYHAKYRALGFEPMSSVRIGRYHYVYNIHAIHRETGEKSVRTVSIARDTDIGLRASKRLAKKSWEESRLTIISKEWEFESIELIQKRVAAGELFHHGT